MEELGKRSTASLLALIAGFVTLFLTFVLILIGGRLFNTMLGQLLKSEVITFYLIIMAVHVLSGIAMLIGAHLIRHEEHIFLASSLILGAGLVALFSFGGLIIGSVLAIIAGILGFKEEF